jgi:hypothetical protein
MIPKVSACGALPTQFASLQRFVDAGWAAPDRRDRTEMRLTSQFTELQSLYDAVVPQLVPILDYLDQFRLDKLSEEQARLLQLAYAIAEIRNAVESWGQPDAVDGWDTRRFIIDEPILPARA